MNRTSSTSPSGFPPPHRRHGTDAFTRIELCISIAAVVLLTAAALPLRSAANANGRNAQCLNNLRQMGMAAQMWASSRSGLFPWQTPTHLGGTQVFGKSGNAWAEYTVMSNELNTPRILACPADEGAKVAPDFSVYPATGNRGAATSYLIDVHPTPEHPSSVLFADRNWRADTGPTSCHLGVNNVLVAYPHSIAWTNAVHGLQGNVVSVDGAVATTTALELRNYFRPVAGPGPDIHFLKAR